jgi:hypothetical protein
LKFSKERKYIGHSVVELKSSFCGLNVKGWERGPSGPKSIAMLELGSLGLSRPVRWGSNLPSVSGPLTSLIRCLVFRDASVIDGFLFVDLSYSSCSLETLRNLISFVIQRVL